MPCIAYNSGVLCRCLGNTVSVGDARATYEDGSVVICRLGSQRHLSISSSAYMKVTPEEKTESFDCDSLDIASYFASWATFALNRVISVSELDRYRGWRHVGFVEVSCAAAIRRKALKHVSIPLSYNIILSAC